MIPPDPDDDLGTLEPGRIGCIDCISFSPNGETLVIGGGNITLRNATEHAGTHQRLP